MKASSDDELMRLMSMSRAIGYRSGLRNQDAEDLASSTMLRAIAAWDDFVPDGAGARERWVATIARNLIKDGWRRKRIRHANKNVMQYSEWVHRDRPLCADDIAANAQARAARELLFAALPARERKVARMVARVSSREIEREEAARRLRMSIHRFDHTVQRVKAALRRAVRTRRIDVSLLFDVPVFFDAAFEGETSGLYGVDEG